MLVVKSRLILIALQLSFVLGACGSGANPATTAMPARTSTLAVHVPQGWVLYGKPTDGFVLALPPDFKSHSTDPNDIDQTIAQLKNTDPQVAEQLDWLKSHSTTRTAFTVFYALDISRQSRASGFMSNISVTKEYYKFKISLDEYAEAALKGLGKMGGVQKPVEHERVKTSNGEFEKLQYTIKIPSYEKVIVIYQFLGVNGGVAYILGMATTTDQMEKYRPVFDQIVQTFQLR